MNTEQPAGWEQRLESMHDTLYRMLVVVRSVADSEKGDFADPSPARSEWTSTPALLRSDLQQAYQTGMVMWHTIDDHGHGLADLIATRRTHSAMTVARALAEAAGRSWNLLEDNVSPHDRIERLLNERLYASHENEALLRGLVPVKGQGPEVTAAVRSKEPLIAARIAAERATRSALLSTARQYLINPVKDRPGKAGSVGRGRAPSMDILNRLFGQAPHASSFFRMNSAVAHSSLHGQVRMLHMTERSDGTLTSQPVPMHPDDLAAQAWPAVAATAVAASTLFAQAGWSTNALDSAIADVVATWDAPPDENLLQTFDALV